MRVSSEARSNTSLEGHSLSAPLPADSDAGQKLLGETNPHRAPRGWRALVDPPSRSMKCPMVRVLACPTAPRVLDLRLLIFGRERHELASP